MLIADSHEFIELYRGDKDLRLGSEIVRLREDVEFVSLAPNRPSPNDRSQFGIRWTAEGPLPELPERHTLRLLPSMSFRFARKESGGIVAWMPTIGRELRRLRPDVLFENPFSWLTPRSYQTHWAMKGMGSPVIYYDPGDEIPLSRRQRVLTPLERPVVNSVARIITYNTAGKRRFVDKYGYPEERIEVVPKPVDVAACRYQGDVGELRGALSNGKGDALIVGYLGRLARYKGSEILLKVAKRALEDRRFDEVRFAFIGGALASEVDERDYVLANTCVTGMLPHDEIPRYLAACDVLVFPDVTRPGGFPTAVAEAMASGTALIVGIGHRTDFMPLRDQETAIAVPPSDSESVAKACLFLAHNRAAGAALAKNVAALAESTMDYPVVAQRYLSIAEEEVYAARHS